jgi:hypothetical protein
MLSVSIDMTGRHFLEWNADGPGGGFRTCSEGLKGASSPGGVPKATGLAQRS